MLLVTGRHEEAEVVLETARKMNKRDEVVVAEVEVKTDIKDKAVSVFALFKVSSLRRCTVILYYIWFTNNLIYYGFTLNADSLIPDLHQHHHRRIPGGPGLHSLNFLFSLPWTDCPDVSVHDSWWTESPPDGGPQL